MFLLFVVLMFVAEGASVLQKICVLDRHDVGQYLMKSSSTVPTTFELCAINALDEQQVAVMGRQKTDGACELFSDNCFSVLVFMQWFSKRLV